MMYFCKEPETVVTSLQNEIKTDAGWNWNKNNAGFMHELRY